jgi:hypothetical protein
LDTPLHEKTVRRLEREIEAAIAGVVASLGQDRLPLLPSHLTTHLMAKAAVAVYEAAVENQQPEHS